MVAQHMIRDAGSPRSPLARLLRAWLLTAVADGLWACVLTLLYGRPVLSVWQGVAATAFGPRMLEGGVPSAAIGVAMHFGVAFAWSAIFLLLVLRSPWLRGVLDSRNGVVKIAAVYGPFIWIVMSAVVIPLLVHKPLVITGRWWIQLLGHIVFVGVPIVWGIGRAAPKPLVAQS